MVTLSRSAWTTATNGRAGRSLSPSRVTGITLHWPTGSNMLTLTQAQVAAKLRGWRTAHVNKPKPWADIGYNYAVDGSGRKWNLTGNTVGAHAGGTPSGNSTIGNLTTVGVLLVIGQAESPNAAMIQGVKELHTELLKALPKATKVYGHRDWVGTECPGAAVYAAIKVGTFSGSATPKPTNPKTLLEEIMSNASERKAFAKEVAAAVWEHELASRNKDKNEGKLYPAGDHLTGNNANIWELVRGTSLTAADITAAVKAGIDSKIDTATVNLSSNE